MRRCKIILLLLSLCSFSVVVSAQKKITGKIQITNVSTTKRIDEQIVVEKKALASIVGEIPVNKVPLITDTKDTIPSQVDDLNGDGNWDELVFVCNLEPNQKRSFKVTLIAREDAPVFKPRTNVHFGKKVGNAPLVSLSREVLNKYNLPRGEGYPYQTDGPSWENDFVAYRHYFDGRNCRDVYGKRTSEMVMDTVGIYPDGKVGDTYHVLRSWGRDIYSVTQGLGAGGLAILDGDTLVRLGVLREQTTDNVDSTVFTLINRGPVRAMFKLDHYGWDVKGKKYNVHQIVTIWAGRHGYANKVWIDGDPANKYLVAGIVHNNDKNGLIEKSFAPGLTGLITHDQQTYNREYFLGLALLLPTSHYAGYFDTPVQGPGILYTYCAKLKMPVQKPLTYYVYSGWELEDKGFRDAKYLINMISHEAMMINTPAKVNLVK